MLSISPAKSARDAAGYFAEHLLAEQARTGRDGPEDYYSSEGDPGRWRGAAAAALGLRGEVKARDFAALALGISPSGERLVQGAGRPDRRAGWDLVFSAPKSVSVAWGLADDRTRAVIANAHRAAVDRALQYIEQEAGVIRSRRGKGGHEHERAAAVIAGFDHGTSRARDPDLHSHNFVFNCAQRDDGTWGTIDSRHFFRAKMAAGALYRAELAARLREIGFGIEPDGTSFRLAGTTREQDLIFSRRRQEIERVLAERGHSSARASEIAALDTREKKTKTDRETLLAEWRIRGAAAGMDRAWVRDLVQHQRHIESTGRDAPAPSMPSPADLIRSLTERASTVSRWQLEAAAYQSASAAGVLADEARAWIEQNLLWDPGVIRLQAADGSERFTSREMYELEARLAETARERQHENHAASEKAVAAAIAAKPTMSDEQREALKHLTGNAGVTCLQAPAGSGKSFLMDAVREAYQHDGYSVIGCAPSGKAARVLAEDSGIKSSTIHALLQDLEHEDPRYRRRLTDRDVIICDEAGMAGSRILARLMDHAEKARAKVILVGDSQQLQPVDAGGAFRLITREIGAAELHSNRRQREGWAKLAVQHFRDGRAAEALRELEKRGHVHVAANRAQAIHQMVERWTDARDPERPGDSILIAARRADVSALNLAAREALAAERSGPAVTVGDKEYQAGDRIIFLRNDRAGRSVVGGIENGTLATLVSVAPDRFVAQTDDGRTVAWNPEHYEHFDRGYAITAHKSQGITVESAHVLIDESMSDKEWTYVASSRSRNAVHLYADSDTWEEAAATMSRSHQKDTSQDYAVTPQTREDEVELER